MGTLAIASAVPFALGGGIGRAIAALFSQSEKGVWYDPSDLTSMFQDSAGTTAAVVGQPVGLVLDKSQGASPLTIANPETMTVSSYDGTGATTISRTAASLSFVNAPSGDGIRFNAILTTHAFPKCTFVASGSGTLVVYCGGNLSSIILTATPTRYSASTSPNSSAFLIFRSGSAGMNASVLIETVTNIPGYHATQSTSTARPILRQSGSLYYLEFDGVDDFLVTPYIDFSSTDKMSVFAGVRKLSDAAIGMIVELSANWTTNAGSLALYNEAAPNFVSCSRGTAVVNASQCATATPYSAPITSIVSSTHNIVVDSTTIRVNTTAATSATGDKGAGNFGNYPLYVGMRAGTTLPFNGHLYSLVVRGALSDASQIAAAESYVNSKTGAY